MRTATKYRFQYGSCWPFEWRCSSAIMIDTCAAELRLFRTRSTAHSPRSARRWPFVSFVCVCCVSLSTATRRSKPPPSTTSGKPAKITDDIRRITDGDQGTSSICATMRSQAKRSAYDARDMSRVATESAADEACECCDAYIYIYIYVSFRLHVADKIDSTLSLSTKVVPIFKFVNFSFKTKRDVLLYVWRTPTQCGRDRNKFCGSRAIVAKKNTTTASLKFSNTRKYIIGVYRFTWASRSINIYIYKYAIDVRVPILMNEWCSYFGFRTWPDDHCGNLVALWTLRGGVARLRIYMVSVPIIFGFAIDRIRGVCVSLVHTCCRKCPSDRAWEKTHDSILDAAHRCPYQCTECRFLAHTLSSYILCINIHPLCTRICFLWAASHRFTWHSAIIFSCTLWLIEHIFLYTFRTPRCSII